MFFFLQENIDWLTEKIQNLEDKLSAADNVKELLQEELHTYREHNQKMSRDLEVITKNIQEKLDLQLPVYRKSWIYNYMCNQCLSPMKL